MSDLIERLTALAILSPPGATRLDLHHRRLIREAADELERLRLSCKGVEGWRDTLFNVFKDREHEWSALSRDLRADDLLRGHRGGKALAYREAAELVLRVSLAAAPVSPSPLMDFGASQVRHQPSAATSPEGSDPTQVKP